MIAILTIALAAVSVAFAVCALRNSTLKRELRAEMPKPNYYIDYLPIGSNDTKELVRMEFMGDEEYERTERHKYQIRRRFYVYRIHQKGGKFLDTVEKPVGP